MIAYYAHSHGSGHCNYAAMFAKQNTAKIVIFTDAERKFADDINVITLENEDVDGSEITNSAAHLPHYLHHCPLGLRKITRRNASILQTILAKNVELLIIDVSVEVATLARVSSIPYAYRRMFGNRDDNAHLQAYRGAIFLVAYFPEAFESADTPSWVKQKTLYLNFIFKQKHQIKIKVTPKPTDVTLIQGFGGEENTQWVVEEITKAFPQFTLTVVGPVKATPNPQVTYTGVVPSVQPYIAAAKILIASCGTNMVNEIMQNGKRFLAIPEERPYDEQAQYARMLEDEGYALRLTQTNIKPAVQAAQNFTSYTLPNAYCANNATLYDMVYTHFKKLLNTCYATT